MRVGISERLQPSEKILIFKAKFDASKEFVDYCVSMVHILEVFRRREKDRKNDVNVRISNLEEGK